MNRPRYDSIENDLIKARKKSMDEAKMKELLLKLRKGATGTLTFGKLVQVLDHLGWNVEPITGWTPLHYTFMKGEHLVDESTSRMSLEALQARHAELVEAQTDRLPDAPDHVGQHVVMDVGDIKKGGMSPERPVYYFYRREWVGTEGISITSPAGEEEGFLPDHHAVEKGHSLTDDPSAVSDLWGWLKKNGLEDSISQALGVEKHVPAAERTRENTGTCAACWGNYKLERGKLVMHGYKRPGYGFIQGQCFGVGYEPLEASDECARKYRDYLDVQLGKEKKRLAVLESGEVVEIEGFRGKIVKKGEPAFHNLFGQAVEGSKRLIKDLTSDIELYDRVSADWEVRPMPKDGELRRGPGFFIKK